MAPGQGSRGLIDTVVLGAAGDRRRVGVQPDSLELHDAQAGVMRSPALAAVVALEKAAVVTQVNAAVSDCNRMLPAVRSGPGVDKARPAVSRGVHANHAEIQVVRIGWI